MSRNRPLAPRLAAHAAAAILTSLGGIHVYWALGGRWGAGSVIPTKDGRPLLRPSPTDTVAVAAGFGAAGLAVLGSQYVNRSEPAGHLLRAVTGLIGGAFLLRAVGDFHSVGLFKRVRGTPFAERDTQLFVPFCLLIAALCTWVALSSPPPRALVPVLGDA